MVNAAHLIQRQALADAWHIRGDSLCETIDDRLGRTTRHDGAQEA
jgi:hypothetical protein